jgi:hypothetical protein
VGGGGSGDDGISETSESMIRVAKAAWRCHPVRRLANAAASCGLRSKHRAACCSRLEA